MNYYDLLDVPKNATTDEIKIHYRKYARIHHPDKGGDAEQFKQLQEAYEILMDPIKRHQYDIDLSGNTYTFTKEDYELIYKYYNSFINSVEVRLMMNLFYSVPKHSRSRINLSALFKKTTYKQSTHKQSTHKQSTSNTLIKTDTIKYIDATLLYDNITLHLKRSLEDVFNRVCKQIIVKTRYTYYHLFIIDCDYNIYLFNDKHSTIKLELTTLPDHNFYKKGYDLCYIKKIDLYEFYYGSKFQIRLPNKFKICCIAKQLSKKKKSSINTFGFYNPKLTQRGNLQIVYQLTHTDMDESNKDILKKLFHRKETFIDPNLPVYNI
jgi:DnaJ-class molecular chaperone